jgi:naphthoate synthase
MSAPTSLTDVRYEVQDGLCWITIDRPQRLNSFTAHTVEELIDCFKAAWADGTVGVVALTGAGERAFCTGGDQKQRAQSGDYGPSRSGLFEIESLHRVIREIPKPVIAAVNGVAIGGGHVLHVICDLSVAAAHARFGQAGPRVGSFDAGFGTGLLARTVGEKRAREIWFLCRQYDAQEAERWGLVNRVVEGRGYGPRSVATRMRSSRSRRRRCASSSSRSTRRPSTWPGRRRSRSAGCTSSRPRRRRRRVYGRSTRSAHPTSGRIARAPPSRCRFARVNRLHGLICSSGWWALKVRHELLPFGLADVELGEEVLEIGPGFGATTSVLADRAQSLTALELDPRYCERLRKRLGERVRVEQGDATQMPFADQSFDTVLCFTMLHHIPSPEAQDRLLAEVERVLRPGGTFAGTDSVGTGRLFRLLHVGDTLVPVPPRGLSRRLMDAGLGNPRVELAGTTFRFRAVKPALG